MGYWSYYLVFLALAWLFQYPWLLFGVLLFFVLRRFIPDPWVWARTSGRIRNLKSQIEANAANAVARRDLARTYLERRRPKAALELLAQARKRLPGDAEILYLLGLARHRAGDSEGALEPLVEAVQVDPRIGFGAPYLAAGDALLQLGRLEEAEDAYERFVHSNSSSVEGLVKLARARALHSGPRESRETLDEALKTYRELPAYARRRERAWWLRAWTRRYWKTPRGVLVFTLLAAALVLGFLGCQAALGVPGVSPGFGGMPHGVPESQAGGDAP